jgi:hypothetical protein
MKIIKTSKSKDTELIPGGKAKGHDCSEYNTTQLSKGRKIEQEHIEGSDLPKKIKDEVAREISKDHLEESKDKKGEKGGKYYDKLDDMEKEIKKEIGETGKESKGDYMRIIESAKKKKKSSCGCEEKTAQYNFEGGGGDGGLGSRNLADDLARMDYEQEDEMEQDFDMGIDLVGIYTKENYLAYVVTLEEYKKAGSSFWIDYLGEDYDPSSMKIVMLKDVSEDDAANLLTQGTGKQVFRDGYEAAQVAAPYIEQSMLEASKESYFDLIKIADGNDDEYEDADVGKGETSTEKNVDDYYAKNEPDPDKNKKELPPWLKKKKKKSSSYFDLTKTSQDYDDFGGDDYQEPYEDDLQNFSDQQAWEDSQADMRDSEGDYESENEEPYYTIEPDKDGDGFVVKKHDTYPKGSVLEGRGRDTSIDFGDTAEELIDKYPDAEILDHPSTNRTTYQDAMNMPRPDDFDELDAGERWEQEEEPRTDYENDTPLGQEYGDGFGNDLDNF